MGLWLPKCGDTFQGWGPGVSSGETSLASESPVPCCGLLHTLLTSCSSCPCDGKALGLQCEQADQVPAGPDDKLARTMDKYMTTELRGCSDEYCWMIKRYKRGTPNPGVSPEDMTSELGPEGRVWAGLAKGGGKTIQASGTACKASQRLQRAWRGWESLGRAA